MDTRFKAKTKPIGIHPDKDMAASIDFAKRNADYDACMIAICKTEPDCLDSDHRLCAAASIARNPPTVRTETEILPGQFVTLGSRPLGPLGAVFE